MNYVGNTVCHVCECAPKEEQDQMYCKMIFTARTIAFGPAFIQTLLHQTLYNCIPEYREPTVDHTASLKATFIKNWPIEKRL